jgi:hypothetical protein
MNTENGQDLKEHMKNVGTESGTTSCWQLEEIRIGESPLTVDHPPRGATDAVCVGPSRRPRTAADRRDSQDGADAIEGESRVTVMEKQIGQVVGGESGEKHRK